MELIVLPPETAAVPIARRLVRDRAAIVDVDLDAVALLTSELVSNVVLHARTDLTIVVELEAGIRVEVHDGAPATRAFHELIAQPPVQVSTQAMSGRGLGLVAVLATRYGLTEPGLRDGKAVWFEIETQQ